MQNWTFCRQKYDPNVLKKRRLAVERISPGNCSLSTAVALTISPLMTAQWKPWWVFHVIVNTSLTAHLNLNNKKGKRPRKYVKNGCVFV